ncbi:bifunctional o-acetylhomoserine/o-acetylserine sulfhydrylase [Leucobacter ruminantium]|uniref:Bifunctional o-acetylhomoserine/o-acetylserine sulfhydrylase n=1 Tax=Leucobacter ruminantium TaxID=1289170 RepID=A0A939RXB1_9MICO|nr:bifunctional o-acetylhomoserine/o-acetylserine sulfhydrylase [Leucobacter ruminantium]
MTQPKWRFETAQIHAGAEVDPVTQSRITPIYQTTSYVFDDAKQAADRFSLSVPGNIYTRMMNPTTAVLEDRIAALEGGSAALALASGQSAEMIAVLNVAGAGDHIVSASGIYGGTYNLFAHTFAKLGIETTFITDQDDLDEWRRAVRPNTKLFFAESIGNPTTAVLDTEGIAGVAHEAGVPFIVDNTIATPYLYRPLEHGADLVIHSVTKFLGGHGAVLGGVLVDGGVFPWTRHADKFPGLTTPDDSYHGVTHTEAFGESLAFIMKARVQLLRDLGPAIAPQSAWQLLQGVETLSVRMRQHVANTQVVAEWLEAHPQVERVHYAGLTSSPWHERAGQVLPDGVGAVLSFEIAGGLEAGISVVNHVELFSHLANIGDVRSLIIHPASTTHSQLTPEQLAETGVAPGLIRLSVGLEHTDDLIADLEQAFQQAR